MDRNWRLKWFRVYVPALGVHMGVVEISSREPFLGISVIPRSSTHVPIRSPLA